MNESGVSAIGGRIRVERERRGMSVRGLAGDVGVSASLISQIETNKSLPSVSTLYAITTALNVPVEELFDPITEEDGRRLSSVSPDAAHAAGAPPRDRHQSAGPHLCPADRDVLTLDSGVTWERLGQIPGQHVEFLKITYRPGATSSSGGDLMRHNGTEYGYLISGALVLSLGFDEHRMSAGDSVCFDSTTPHGYRNEGRDPAIGIWFVLENT
jgi:transcriptional regulator with XRE-family HTH domain/quercetin dioxygenase-like cupin family protein